MDLFDLFGGLLSVPWWFWVMLVGIGILIASYIFGSLPLAGLGALSVAVGAIAALRKAS